MYTTEQRLFIVEEYFRTRSFVLVRGQFQEEFPDASVPAKSTIQDLVKKWLMTGSVTNSKRAKKRTVRTRDVVADIAKLVERCPNQSKRSIAKQSGITRRSVQRILEELKPEHGQGASTSTQPSSEHELHESSHETEENTAEEIYEDDDFSEPEEIKVDIADTQILLNEVEPAGVGAKPQYPTSTECELFGEYIAKNLQLLPLNVSLKLQSEIQALVMQTRLEYIREHPSEAPAMVKQETPLEEEENETTTNQQATSSRAQKRPRKHEQTKAKRFKPSSDAEKSSSHDQPKQIRRTDCTVFAEHIAIQLEQLPEELSLQLQSDIYALITQVYPQSVEIDSPDHVKVKAEPLDVN